MRKEITKEEYLKYKEGILVATCNCCGKDIPFKEHWSYLGIPQFIHGHPVKSGIKNPMFGKFHSKESKQKMSLSHEGLKRTDEDIELQRYYWGVVQDGPEWWWSLLDLFNLAYHLGYSNVEIEVMNFLENKNITLKEITIWLNFIKGHNLSELENHFKLDTKEIKVVFQKIRKSCPFIFQDREVSCENPKSWDNKLYESAVYFKF